MIKNCFFSALTTTVALSFAMTANAAATIESTDYKEGTITIWISTDKGYNGLDAVGKRFTKDTGIPVNVVASTDVTQQFLKHGMTSHGPDIVVWAHDRLGDWVKAGLLSPVELDDNYKSKFSDYLWHAEMIDGKNYGYPIAVEALSLVCNEALLPKSQIPENAEDFLDLDKKLMAEKSVHALEWDYRTAYFSYPFIAALI